MHCVDQSKEDGVPVILLLIVKQIASCSQFFLLVSGGIYNVMTSSNIVIIVPGQSYFLQYNLEI